MRTPRQAVTSEAWLDGLVVPTPSASPSVASSTFHMGSGVFDGLMAYRNGDHWHLHLARPHLERFCVGCRRMRLTHNWTPTDLEQGIRELLDRCPSTTHYIRPIAFRGAPEILLTPSESLPISVAMFGVPADRDVPAALRATLSPVQRVSSEAIPVRWKVCGAYANSFIAQTHAQEDGFDTAIFLDRAGRISEASVANVFFIGDEGLVTPHLRADVFPGLTRVLVLWLAEQLGVPVAVRDVDGTELDQFTGGFICSTLMEIKPLTVIDSVRFDTTSSPIFEAILSAFRDLTHERAPYPEELGDLPATDGAQSRRTFSSRS